MQFLIMMIIDFQAPPMHPSFLSLAIVIQTCMLKGNLRGNPEPCKEGIHLIGTVTMHHIKSLLFL